MNATKWMSAVVWLAVGMTVAGCEEPPVPPTYGDYELRDALTKIEAVCEGSRGAREGQAHHVYREMRSVTAGMTNDELLLELYRIYTGKSPRWRATVQGEINSCDVARVVLAERLAPGAHEDTPRLLVGLLMDRKIELVPEAERALARAITTCGRPCLPHLKVIPGDHSRADLVHKLIGHIERGEAYQP